MNVKKTKELYNHIIQLEIKIIVEKNTLNYLLKFIYLYYFYSAIIYFYLNKNFI